MGRYIWEDGRLVYGKPAGSAMTYCVSDDVKILSLSTMLEGGK